MNINEIDLKNLHLQSKPIQLLVALLLAAVIVLLGYLLFFKDQWSEYQTMVEKEETLKSEFSNKAVQAANRENLEQELILIQQSTDILLKQLPTNAEIPGLIQEMHQAAAKNGLVMNAVTPLQTAVEGPIERLPFAFSVTGTHQQIADFSRDIGKMSRIVTLSNLQIANSDTKDLSGSKLNLDAIANTYKALDTAAEASAASAVASAPKSVK